MNFLRTLLIFIGMIFLAAVVHVLVYNTSGHWYVSSLTVTDSLFIVGVVIFLPALVAATGAYSLFFGLRYAFGVMLSPKYREKYPRYFDYVSTKNVEIKSTIFNEVMLASGLMLVCAIILTLVN